MTRSTQQAFAGAGLLLDEGFRARFLLAWRLLRDDRVSPLKYALPALMALYIVSPIDTVPDVLLGVGQIDDLGIVVIAFLLFVRIMPWLAPPEVLADYARGSRHAAAEAPSTGTAGDSVEANYRIRK